MRTTFTLPSFNGVPTQTTLALVLAFSLTWVACGGGDTTGDYDADIGGGETNVLDDGSNHEPDIDTTIDNPNIQAGNVIDVLCSGYGFDLSKVEIVVGQYEETEVSEGVALSEDGVPLVDASIGTTLPADLTLPEGVTKDGTKLTFTKTETYYVACYAPDAGLIDTTPVEVIVVAGPAKWVQTEAEPTEIKAGEWVDVNCSAEDSYGNPITSGFEVVTAPPEGVKTTGMSVQMTVAVPHTVACRITDTAVVDDTPVEITVNANTPKKIRTTVDPSTFKAGESAEISCSVEDYYGNAIPTDQFPLSIYLPKNLQLIGKALTTTIADLYLVKCVPQNEDWKYFQLFPASVTVTPGDPAELTVRLIPEKAYYGRNESVQYQTTVHDMYGNVVPDAEMEDVQFSPAIGIEPVTDHPEILRLKEEGTYTLTFQVAGFPDVKAVKTIRVEGSGPLLNIYYPPRGATIKGKPSVTVTGSVGDDETEITTFTINGETVPKYNIKPDGTFTHIINPGQGLNLVKAYVENGAGMKYETGRGFYFSYVFYPMDAANPEAGLIEEAVRTFLGRDFFDDGDHTPPPDDLATIIEQFVISMNLDSLIPNPIAEAGPYQVLVKNITFDKPTVSLHLRDGGLNLWVEITDIHLDVEAKGECKVLFIDFCPDLSGDVSIDKLRILTSVDLWMDENKVVKVKLADVQTLLEDLNVNIEGWLGGLLDPLLDGIVSGFQGTIQRMVEQELINIVDTTVTDLLAKFEINESFELPSILGSKPASIGILTKPSYLKVMANGLWLDMGASIYAPKNISHSSLGSIARANCLSMSPGEFELPYDAQLGLAAFDDVLNQAFFSVWNSGVLNLTIDEETLGDVDLSQYSIDDLSVQLDFYLPPILTDCNEDDALQIQVGDLYADVWVTLMGMYKLKIGLFMQAIAQADLYTKVNEEGQSELAIRLEDIPLLDIEVVSLECLEDVWNPDMECDFPLTTDQLMDMLLPAIEPALAEVNGTELISFAIPAIDLGSLDPSMPAGLAFKFEVERLFRQWGFTVVQGHLGVPE